MKKIKLKSEEFIIPVINYMLREFDADYESVKKKPIIKKILISGLTRKRFSDISAINPMRRQPNALTTNVP